MRKLIPSLWWTMRLKFPVYRCIDCSQLVSKNGPKDVQCNQSCQMHCLNIDEEIS